MRTIALFGTACALAVGTACVVQGHAADLGFPAAPVYAEPDPQFEFGTGWYLRGDASFGEEDHPVLDATPAVTTKQDWNTVLGGGVGYKFNSFLRVDATGEWISPDTLHRTDAVNGIAVGSSAKIQKYDALANLYIDLGTWSGITPYVGGGAGVAIYDPSERLAVDVAPIIDNTSSHARFAWAAMAGVSYQVDQNIALDVGYRHLDLGRFSTTLLGYSIDHHYTEDQVRVGLRYMIF